jgi:hypothetical protein
LQINLLVKGTKTWLVEIRLVDQKVKEVLVAVGPSPLVMIWAMVAVAVVIVAEAVAEEEAKVT